jgi:pimeloyl-ACP methyl ester carboxylesterase
VPTRSYAASVGTGERTGAVRLATGVTLPYVARGDAGGTPLVCVHAWLESRGSFDRLRPLLPDDTYALAPDLRGHGEADKPPSGYALTDVAADVRAFLDALGLGPAVLVGSSSGGYVAQQVAVDAPERVSGLVLLGAPRSLQGRPPFADEVDRLAGPLDPAWVRESLTWFPRFQEVPDAYVDARVADALRIPAAVWQASLDGLASARPPTEAGTIRAPTLVLHGARDALLPVTEAQALAAAIPTSRLVVYENTGHLVLWEQPGRIAGDVGAFFTMAT